jgi:hypothetical protein
MISKAYLSKIYARYYLDVHYTFAKYCYPYYEKVMQSRFQSYRLV